MATEIIDIVSFHYGWRSLPGAEEAPILCYCKIPRIAHIAISTYHFVMIYINSINCNNI